jgi:hypothetical protein
MQRAGDGRIDAKRLRRRQCLGFVLAHGHRGYEAFTAGGQSLGLFETRDAAIHELTGGMKPFVSTSACNAAPKEATAS